MIDLNNHKLELNYPCNWCYKIVIKHEHNGNKIAKEVFVNLSLTDTDGVLFFHF